MQLPVLAELVKLTSEVASPCENICVLDDNVCIGCYRTADEIEEWRLATNARRQEILDRIAHDRMDY